MSEVKEETNVIFTVGEICSIVRLSNTTVRRLIDSGEMIGWKSGSGKFRHRRVLRDDLARWMKINHLPIRFMEEYEAGRAIGRVVDGQTNGQPKVMNGESVHDA